MARSKVDTLELGGQDSFVDVVTNLVGVLIILVVIIGLRSKPSPAEIAIPAGLAGELDGLTKESGAVESDMRGLVAQINSVRGELSSRSMERQQLSYAVAVAEKELAARREKLSAEELKKADLRQQLVASQQELDHQQSLLETARTAKPRTVEMHSYPTPLSKTVLGKEIHFQLSGGRVAYVPIEELFELARNETRANIARVSDLTDRVMTVGPKQGFEMRYTVDVSQERQGQMAIRSKEWQVVPVQPRLGESAPEALAEDSSFRRLLSRYAAKDTTITIWTYPDSFGEFRALNEELHRLGYATAGRPLPDGFPIGGSPQGSKSAAQ